MAKLKTEQAPITELTNPQPKKARRLKVLSTSKLSSNQQTIYNTNATTSPLLKLPPEIRNRIWGFLFGGKIVHIQYEYTRPGRRMVHFICQVPNDDEDAAEHITHHNELDGSPDRFEIYRSRHQQCSGSGTVKRTSLPMAALQTCRQVHEEAALLPFQRNEFSCALITLGPFLQSLFQSQARAIESVTLHCRHPYRTITLKKLVKAKLKALKALTYFVEMSSDVHTNPTLHPAWSECFAQTEAVAATSATIVPYVPGQGDAGFMAPSRTTMREWATSFSKTMVVAQD
ncbi:hypothetical protein LTR56_021060 [Elasticomyces elasticus]|nr:hypothetical protein LTR56_021060 [Elasticomyces elasticus]KAK3635273.1 hypothetical protein LTR22_019269 [Elasticomyces elasticus]KAK4911643.1 hypothetical protein LTR49_019807 [Elasticomyces elasticus]KAK5748918.1 hypothetical protein LTS12_021023 [Elasticomyces elasticus]